MFIESQDGKLLINTDNVASIFCVDNAIRVMYTFDMGGDLLGVYESAEKADEEFERLKEELSISYKLAKGGF